ncbi:MAG: CotH kinase family protein [Candidatus Amulumruptor caecigallinarius]|nr:CotH kinase family protein [Candidatus Amulumruptor caecigallinarius]
MNKNNTIYICLSLIILTTIISTKAQNNWLHIFLSEGRINTGKLSELDSITFIKSKATDNDLSQDYDPQRKNAGRIADRIKHYNREDTENDDVIPNDSITTDSLSIPFDSLLVCRNSIPERYPLSEIDSIITGNNIATMKIEVEGEADITSKVEYLNANLSVEGNGNCADFAPAAVSIRGRGNTSWSCPKKSYRLKFAKKQSLCGLKKAKSFALIANYLDPSMLENVVASEIARRLDMPYTNSWTPINLYINGAYRGLYFLTEKIGINSGSVNINEDTGILWELDSYFDDEPKFRSPIFNLPVMLKDPDPADMVADDFSEEDFINFWTQDFINLENSILSYTPGGEADNEAEEPDESEENDDKSDDATSDWMDHMDADSLVKYLIVNNVCGNHELCSPKSVYMYKPDYESKYFMGPIWDFDWGFNFPLFNSTYAYNSILFWNPSHPGSLFFKSMMKDPRAMDIYKDVWNRFMEEVYPELEMIIDQWVDKLYVGALQNAAAWPAGKYTNYIIPATSEIKKHAANLKTWIKNRIEYLDKAPNAGLF